MSEIIVRDATDQDAAAIAEIYNHYVTGSTATFDTEPKTAGERRAWLATHDAAHPVLVAEDSGAVVAWGSITSWDARLAWRHTVEISSYVAPDSRGRGIGPLLMGELLERARQAGHHAVLAQIVAENEASLQVTQRAGFEIVGHLREVGRKFDRWLDVVILEKTL